MKRLSFVPIMPVGGNDVHMHLCVEDFIDEAVLLRDTPTPHPSAVSRKRLGMSCACAGMKLQLFDERSGFPERCWLRALQGEQIVLGLRRIDNAIHQPTRFRKSSKLSLGNISKPSPRRICSRPTSTRWKNSSRLISVGSDVSSRTTRRRYFATRWSAPSSSATMPKLRRISAFKDPICAVDITSVSLVSGRKGRYYFSTKQIKR